jgi:1-deoxy-D-xylulose-5-phosphate reductoisomerase
MKTVAILGSTGTIGRNTLDVIRRHPREFKVAALAAGANSRLLEAQAREFRPRLVSLGRPEDAASFRRDVRIPGLKVLSGPEGAEEIGGGPESGLVVSAITGIAGLRPTLAAVRAGKTVALANKESMVVAGPLLRKAAEASGAVILPVDSEHSGVFQCLNGGNRPHVTRVILTASGGPFFRTPLRELRTKTVAEALAHPRWRMGRKVTVDSATLMNKGLELIEAQNLFDLEPGELGILIHPQSIVHALVELRDGSVLAQLSPTDMRFPIQYALTYPERRASGLPSLNLARAGALEFYDVEPRRYPLLALALRALREGGSFPVALNAANEIAVDAFLAGRIGFLGISEVLRAALDRHVRERVGDLDDVFDIDRRTRERTSRIIQRKE